MPGFKSKAQSGKGSVLAIGDSTATPTFIVIGEVTSSSFSGRTADTADVTSFDSGTHKSFIPVIIDSGTVKLVGNRVSSDLGQQAVTNAFEGLEVLPFTLTLPKTAAQTTSGDVISFDALIQSSDFTVDVTKAVTFDITLKVSDAIVTTPGT